MRRGERNAASVGSGSYEGSSLFIANAGLSVSIIPASASFILFSVRCSMRIVGYNLKYAFRIGRH